MLVGCRYDDLLQTTDPPVSVGERQACPPSLKGLGLLRRSPRLVSRPCAHPGSLIDTWLPRMRSSEADGRFLWSPDLFFARTEIRDRMWKKDVLLDSSAQRERDHSGAWSF